MPDALATLLAKEEIRELALLYSRAIDRKDMALCRALYTRDATDAHGQNFDGSADGFIDYLAKVLPGAHYTGHHICNHLISVDGDTGEGEVYALAYHMLADETGAMRHDVMSVRYLDQYRKENGRWRFARRRAVFDSQLVLPLNRQAGEIPEPAADESYRELSSRLFRRGEPD
jgi:hypothetical protein